MVRLLTKDQDLNNLNQAFLCIDKDNDGIISVEEMKSFANQQQGQFFGLGDNWVEILANIDLDSNGMVDFHEFYTAAVDTQKVFTK